jgi:hypothetical protein
MVIGARAEEAREILRARVRTGDAAGRGERAASTMDAGAGTLERMGSELAFRESRHAEVGGFGAGRMIVHQLGMTGDDEHRRKVGRNQKDPADPKMAEVELVEFSWRRERLESNPECGFGCMVFGQDKPMLNAGNTQNACFVCRC